MRTTASGPRARLLTTADRARALAHLARAPRKNLFLIEIAEAVGRPAAPGEVPSQVLASWRSTGPGTHPELRGLAALRPSLVLDACMECSVVSDFVQILGSLETGLVKSPEPLVSELWKHLERRGRRAVVDRIETAYALDRDRAPAYHGAPGVVVRKAVAEDLDALVHAARASLREEQRPDPFHGDPVGFRRWVRGRLHRARVVELQGEIGFVGYADVRRKEGWLIQGVYTWPEQRRRGLARAGMSALIAEALAAGADHVQLAVVDGNEPAISLYRALGFEPFDTLRTVLFV